MKMCGLFQINIHNKNLVKYIENKALRIIKKVAKRTDMGVAVLEAEMTLKMYNGEIPNRIL